ncbi:MAG: hypothetical protein RR549_04050 [Oscillospiraceae bacterium]
MKNIIFICTGNTCRSPMAEFIFKQKIKEKNLINSFKVESYGITPNVGEPMAENAKAVLQNHYGLKEQLNSHKAKPLEIEIAKNADFIFCMNQTHKQIILLALPNLKEKNNIYVLDENMFKNNNLEIKGIPDPYGGNLQAYECCFNVIEKLINLILENKDINLIV